jgi:hypothetical protein
MQPSRQQQRRQHLHSAAHGANVQPTYAPCARNMQLLGFHLSRDEVSAILSEVDHDGSGEVEYSEFIEIMTTTLARMEEKREEEGGEASPVPFALLATAYRCVGARWCR